MDYDELLPDWDRDDHSKRAGLDARLQDMVVQHLANDPLWPTTVTGLADDLVANDEVREMLPRACIVIENLAIWMYGGRQAAIDRFTSDLAQLRAIAMKGVAE